jgi:hypothetical protein
MGVGMITGATAQAAPVPSEAEAAAEDADQIFQIGQGIL